MPRARIRRGRLLTSHQVMQRLLAEKICLEGVTCALPAVRRGDSWFFCKQDLDEWIRRQRDSTGPQSG